MPLMDLLNGWPPITGPRLGVTELLRATILSPMFVEAVCMPRGLIVYNCVHGGDWNT
ncbi:unnamed protein product [Staurois parvus]|uniref:Uncharacterized protein n=1 Tax=Staurois parvus TaxID=386267 RepID=A0ABN9GNC5_9NEOB|nr:unnamed protein product [Staurois parvus]